MYEYCANCQYFVQSIIYIYILSRPFTNFLQNDGKRRRTRENAADSLKSGVRRRISRRFRVVFLRFRLIHRRNAEISSVFTAQQRKTERFTADFMQFAAVSSVPGRVLRVLSAVGKTPKKDGARPFPLPKSQNHPPVSLCPRGSGGRARGFRRPAAGAARDSPRKNFAREFLFFCSARLV